MEKLAADLRAWLPDVRGFSTTNFWRMRQFHIEYFTLKFLEKAVLELEKHSRPILAQVARELRAAIPWSHHVELLAKVKASAACLHYHRATAQFGWSRSVLLVQIKSGAYERAVTEKKAHHFPLALPEHFVDVLFYHRFLKALVASDLKIGSFEPEHAGEMDFYLNLLNDKELAPDDQLSIGTAEYHLQAKLPAEFKGRLPNAK